MIIKYKIAIYSCCFGNYRNFEKDLDNQIFNENIDYYLYTDNNQLKSKFWKIIIINLQSSPDIMDDFRLTSKYIKFNIQKELHNYDTIIWNVSIISDLFNQNLIIIKYYF